MSDTTDAGTAGWPNNVAEAAAQIEAAHAALTPTSGAPKRLVHKTSILGRKDKQFLDVPVPEWAENGEVPIVTIGTISNTEREEFENSIAKQGADGVTKTEIRGMRAKFLVKVIVDPDTGNRVFDDSDAGQLGTKSSSAIGRLFEKATAFNRMFQTGLEETAKN